MTPQAQERTARTRLRSLAKARKARARNAERARKEDARTRERFREWVLREQLAFALHAADPGDGRALCAWRKVLRERPPRYGRKEAA